jgi:tRNA nucleotidyltransferase/poly(A) polymerase
MKKRPKEPAASDLATLPGGRERLRRLRSRKEIVAAARQVRLAGMEAWIVGGAVRDALLARPVLDVDLAIAGDAEKLAQALERGGFGRCVPLSEESPRVYRVAGRRDLDLAELERGSIESDLMRRDFTANAMAVHLVTGDLVDPCRGLADLHRGALRLVSEANLAEDPLRALRAARFLATHGLLPDAAALSVCRRVAPRLSEAAAERIQAELTKILEAPRAFPALLWAGRARLLGPALGLPASAKRLDILDALAVRRRKPAERLRLRLCLLAARLGLSPREASRWLAERRWSRELAGESARLLELTAQAREAAGTDEQWRWVRDAGALWKDALSILVALEPARRGRARRLAGYAARARRGLRVRGRDVLAWTGLPPGPVVGKLLRELEVETLRGRLRSRLEARNWLLERCSSKLSRRGPGPRGL